MISAVGFREFGWMVEGAIEKIRGGHTLLSQLDAAIGDGDHGTTMLRGVNLLDKMLSKEAPNDLKSLTEKMGWTLMGVDGGSTGPLLGTFFLGISESIGDRQTLDAAALAEVFAAGLASVKRQTKAEVGDKTMIDALVPAIQSLQKAAHAGKGIMEALRSAAEAAQKGALATKEFVARFGKAKFSGERTRGHQDPGATSICLILEGFYEGLLKRQVT